MSRATDMRENGVSIVIPTYKRPDSVRRAVESIFRQTGIDRPSEIIVADNDPAGSAEITIKGLSENAPIEIRYVHIPEPGVSNARNGALGAARGRFIAFLDDDMEATEGWLAALLNTSTSHKIGIVFGPINAVMPNPSAPETPYFSPYFSRAFDAPDGETGVAFGTGGSLLDLSLCALPSPPFNPDLNETGGEDDQLFEALREGGASFGWSPSALALEHVPAARATAKYVWHRNFAFGQGPTQIAADQGLAGLPGILKWMIIGTAQACLFAPAYGALTLLGRPARLKFMAKTAQGLGKILWWDGLSPRLYGQGNKAA